MPITHTFVSAVPDGADASQIQPSHWNAGHTVSIGTSEIQDGAVTLAKQADMATASVVYRKTAGSGAPEVQTLATLKTDLGLTGTNSGDQTSIVGITGSLAEFNAALTGADFATGGGTATGTNTGDQTSIVGITGTKAQFDTACTDGNFLYTGDVTQYTDEMAQDAVGSITDATLEYDDSTPFIRRAALTGDVTASAGSNATTIPNGTVTYAKMQDVSAISRLLGRGSSGGAGDVEEITLGSGLSMSGTTLSSSGGADSRMPLWVTDFTLTGAAQNDFNMGAISSGTFNTSTAGEAGHPGVVLWRSSTTTNSGVQCTALTNAILIAGGEQWDVNFRTMGAFTNTTFRSGLLDVQAVTAATDGAYLQFDGSGTLSGACRSNSAETVTGTTYSLSTGTWYHGRISINSGATTVTFYLYDDSGTQLWSDTVSTNIPTAAGRETGAGTIATNVGTSATDLVRMDRMKFSIPGRTVARGAA